MAGDELAWRAEAACRDAWPCDHEIVRNGWLIRASGGATRRTNSINPLSGTRAGIETVLDEARAVYAGRGQSLMVRVPDIAGEMDADLTRFGFAPGAGETATLYARLGEVALGSAAQIGPLDAEWLAARARAIGWNAAEMAVYRQMLGLVAGPIVYAAARDEGEIGAVAYGAIAHGLLVVESVVTDARYRRRGLARRVVAALLDWGRGQGAAEACLQVTADNVAAVSLYRGLGFTQELYRYHYRTA